MNVANIFTAKSSNKNGFNNLSSSVTPQKTPAIYIIVDVGEEDEQMIQAISESSGADTFQISNHWNLSRLLFNQHPNMNLMKQLHFQQQLN